MSDVQHAIELGSAAIRHVGVDDDPLFPIATLRAHRQLGLDADESALLARWAPGKDAPDGHPALSLGNQSPLRRRGIRRQVPGMDRADRELATMARAGRSRLGRAAGARRPRTSSDWSRRSSWPTPSTSLPRQAAGLMPRGPWPGRSSTRRSRRCAATRRRGSSRSGLGRTRGPCGRWPVGPAPSASLPVRGSHRRVVCRLSRPGRRGGPGDAVPLSPGTDRLRERSAGVGLGRARRPPQSDRAFLPPGFAMSNAATAGGAMRTEPPTS